MGGSHKSWNEPSFREDDLPRREQYFGLLNGRRADLLRIESSPCLPSMSSMTQPEGVVVTLHAWFLLSYNIRLLFSKTIHLL